MSRRAGYRAGAAGVLAACAAALALTIADPGSGQSAARAVTPQPLLGLPTARTQPFGIAPSGAPGETWAFGLVGSAPPVIDGEPLELPREAGVLVRRTDATDWQVVRPPEGADGKPLALGPATSPGVPGRVGPRGELAFLAVVADADEGSRQAFVVRNPGGALRLLPDPGTQPPIEDPVPAPSPAPTATPTAVPAATPSAAPTATPAATPTATPTPPPADPLEPPLRGDERLAGRNRAAFAVVEEDGRAQVLAAPQPDGDDGGGVDGVLLWDGRTWSREPIEAPPGSEDAFEVLALEARGADDAWFVARVAGDRRRGVVLYRRSGTGDGPVWREVPIDRPVFAEDGASGRDVRVLDDRGVQPLTVGSEGLWIDGRVTGDGAANDFTLFVGRDGEVGAAWCSDEAACEYRLGLGFQRAGGYRSFAWPGGGPFGRRVITDPRVSGAADDTTSRGTWASLEDERFERNPGVGKRANDPNGGAFAAPDDGWLSGEVDVVRISRAPQSSRLTPFPVPFRRPLAAVAGEPGKRPGALDAQAIAVGTNGTVARYVPGTGWQPETLLTSTGQRATPELRGVAWPEPGYAFAVGDEGEIWEWRAKTGLWQRDGATPLELDAQLTGVAFQPGDGFRGFAAGRAGTLLRYDLSWQQEPLPAGAERLDFVGVAFAGRQAIAVGRGAPNPGGERQPPGVLLDDGAGFRRDEQAEALIAELGPPNAVAGLPDGGAVMGGTGWVAVRDRADTPWRLTERPPSGLDVVTVAGVREGERIRPVVAVFRAGPGAPGYLTEGPDVDIPPPAGVPAPQPRPFSSVPEGFLLRETDGGWRDEQRDAYRPTDGGAGGVGDDPLRPDPVSALLLDANGDGWAVGGQSGVIFGAGDDPQADRALTASIYRYAAVLEAVPAVTEAPVPLEPGPLRLVVAGNAQCEDPCADLANGELGPDRQLRAALDHAAKLHARPDGPAAFLYTGSRLTPSSSPLPGVEASRYAEVARGPGGLPFYPAVSPGESAGRTAAAFGDAFAGFPAPLGDGPLPRGIETRSIRECLPAERGGPARTHYAFDVRRTQGRLRVIVIDNSQGSLSASDGYQVPQEGQEVCLRALLDEARRQSVPAIVVGNRALEPTLAPNRPGTEDDPATDGARMAEILKEGGASAYFFNRPDENRRTRVPAADGDDAVPAFATGSLGYGVVGVPGDPYFSEAGFLLVEFDLAARDPGTNRVPVGVRLIPLVGELALDAADGVLLRRSRPALFTALARRPRSGSRRVPSGEVPPDPYIPIPPEPVLTGDARSRIEPEFEFDSSDRDIADFVARDPASGNARDVLLGADDRAIADPRSGLLCAFNAGTTTVTVRTGGLAFSQALTVQPGVVQRPCGTRPLDPSRLRPEIVVASAPSISPPEPAPPPPPPPPGLPAIDLPPAPIPPAAAVAPVRPPAKPAPSTPPDPLPPVGLVTPPAPPAPLPPAVPPPAPNLPRPAPPGGAPVPGNVPVSQPAPAPKREEETDVATEQLDSSAVAYTDERPPVALTGGAALLVLIVAAGAGAALRPRRTRGRPAYARNTQSNPWRSR